MPHQKKPTQHELPRMLSIAEVADMFGRSARTIRSWIQKGLLQPVKVGNAVFVPQTQIDALLAKSRDPRHGPDRAVNRPQVQRHPGNSKSTTK